MTAVAAVSNAVQCKHAAAILRELAARGPLDKRTAVVLTDENLLLPLLYALPPEIARIAEGAVTLFKGGLMNAGRQT